MDAVISVSQLNRYLKTLVEGDRAVRNLFVRGELSNFTNHVRSGHFYFTLKDGNSSIRGVMFKTYASQVRFRPEDGMGVVAFGSVRFFERDGITQFYCEELQPDGAGALALAFEQLKERLRQEGLFDPAHKKPLPSLPRRIGVVTSKTGAALQDIINILSRRYPLGTVVLIPALVQGEGAPMSISRAIRTAGAREDLDVLIVGRGGGSAEDLWAFNDEGVARAIYHCPIPVISAVGHEVDFTIADFVADLRAPTPSAAAELCAPDIRDLKERVLQQRAALDRQLQARFTHLSQSLSGLQKRLGSMEPDKQIELYCQRLSGLQKRLELSAGRTVSLWEQKHSQLVQNLYRNGRQLVEKKEERCFRQMAALEALSPLKVLTRGYSITRSAAGKILYSPDQVKDGDKVTTRLAQGELVSIVQKEQGGTEKEAPAPALEGGDSHGGKNL